MIRPALIIKQASNYVKPLLTRYIAGQVTAAKKSLNYWSWMDCTARTDLSSSCCNLFAGLQLGWNAHGALFSSSWNLKKQKKLSGKYILNASQ